jgi:Glutathione S-transferase, N-terminal domain
MIGSMRGNEFGVTKTPQYRVLNPNGLVPTIEDGNFQLWESNVIVRYLAQKNGHGRLYPAVIRTRFDAERWMDWQATVFWPALRPLFIELIRTPLTNRDATVISRAETLSLAAAQILDAHLSDRTFLAGESFFHRGHSSRDDCSPVVRARYPSSRTAQPTALVRPDEATSALSGSSHDALELTRLFASSDVAVDIGRVVDGHNDVIAGLDRMQAKGRSCEYQIARLQGFAKAIKIAPQPVEGLGRAARHGPQGASIDGRSIDGHR